MKLTRRHFLRNTAAAGAVGATITAPVAAEPAEPLSPTERVAEAVRNLKEAMADCMDGKPGHWHACLIQRSNGVVVCSVARYDGEIGEDILDRQGNPVADEGAI